MPDCFPSLRVVADLFQAEFSGSIFTVPISGYAGNVIVIGIGLSLLSSTSGSVSYLVPAKLSHRTGLSLLPLENPLWYLSLSQ